MIQTPHCPDNSLWEVGRKCTLSGSRSGRKKFALNPYEAFRNWFRTVAERTESVGVGFSSQTISVRLTIGTSLPYLRGFFVWVPKQTPHAPFFPRTLPSECSRKQQALFSFWRTLRACRVPRKLRRVPRGPPSSVLFRLLVWRREWAVIWTNRSLQLRSEVQSLLWDKLEPFY